MLQRREGWEKWQDKTSHATFYVQCKTLETQWAPPLVFLVRATETPPTRSHQHTPMLGPP
jgi:hypothetical protein